MALREWLVQVGAERYRGEQVLRWVYQRGARTFSEMSDIPAELRSQLTGEFVIPEMHPTKVLCGQDGTRKLLFELSGGVVVETVVIPDPPRLTLCISSQAGCAMGCCFCATARMGLQRNLTANEIVGQVQAAREELGNQATISNLVFMGMGEPLHNYGGLVGALEILTAPWGVGISPRRITVSTVGIVPRLEQLAREVSVNIAVSLAGTTEETRARLMPVNRKYPLHELMETCRRLPIPQRKRITFEYVMLAGVNDSEADARRLVGLLHGIRAKVNLISFNPFPGCGFEPSSSQTVAAFQARLLSAGINATVRASRGSDIRAACGQLAGEMTL